MRTLLLHILFLAISCQPSAFSQNSMVLDQKPEANILSSMVNGLSSTAKSQKPYVKNNNSVDYYESQIRLADSLYKNYLPQYNFDEVKKAVAFFEESPSKDNSRNSATQQLIDSLSHRLIDSDFLRAKAHYYHAVGLTEKDDVVGACEHYLHALEIMEPLVGTLPLWRPKTNDKGLKANDKSSTAKSQKPKVKKNKTVDCCQLSVDNPQDYEKIRFVSLIYTRLGQLFNNENYCSLAILKYKKALYYVETLGNNDSKSHILKFIGNSYQLSNKPDSALYYYNESLKYNSSLSNKLDVEKSIAQILFYNIGERDSAYRLIKNNLDKLEQYAAKYSYYQILGEMYYNDNSYDSAIKYLNLSMNATNKHTILSSSNILSSIYDSIENRNLKIFYDNLSLSILNNNHNKGIYTTKLQELYTEYIDRKQVREIEKQKVESRKQFVKYLVIASSLILILVFIIFVLRHKHRKDKILYDEEISNMNSEISEKNAKIESDKQAISEINSELENITQKYNKLSNDYISKKKELESSLSRKVTKNDIRNFCSCENCKKILANIDSIKNDNLKINNLEVLTNDEMDQLLEDADTYLYDFRATITNKYPKLKDEDLYCICLLLMNIKGPTIAALLGKEYNSIWSRIKKIYSIIGINSKDNLHKIFY